MYRRVDDARQTAFAHIVDDVGTPVVDAPTGECRTVGVYRDHGFGNLAAHDVESPAQSPPLFLFAHFIGTRTGREGSDVYHAAALGQYLLCAHSYLALGLLAAALVEAVGRHIDYSHDLRMRKVHKASTYIQRIFHVILICYKGSANRREYKINLFIFILEVQPAFTAGAVKGQVEDNAKKKQMFFLICIVEATPTLSIDSASGGSRRVASMI